MGNRDRGRRRWFLTLLLSAAGIAFTVRAVEAQESTRSPGSFRIVLQGVPLRGVPLPGMTIEAVKADGTRDTAYHGAPAIQGLRLEDRAGEVPLPHFDRGELALRTDLPAQRKLFVTASEITVVDGVRQGSLRVTRIPGWLSLLPPLLAIVLAMISRNVLASLFLGVLSGAVVLTDGNVLTAYLRTLDTHLLGQLADTDHLQVIVFTLFIGALVGVMSRSGGTQGVVELVTPFANTPRRGQVAGWGMGLLVFFDDYANSLLVGPTMRPITDRLRISREKLAYIVDSTAAPVAGLALISTWVGTEIGYIQDAYTSLGLVEEGHDVYYTFLLTIPYRFYALLAILFVLLVAWTGRDFGAMWRAERRARHDGHVQRPGANVAQASHLSELEPPADAVRRAANALIPITLVIGLVMIGLYWTGRRTLLESGAGADELTLRNIISEADSYEVLMVSSFTAALAAIGLAWWQRILTLAECVEAWMAGARSVSLAVAILVLAWALSGVCDRDHLNTAWYVVEQTEGLITPAMLPTLSFLLAAVISFATGTSFGTMGILTPLMIVLAHRLLIEQGTVDPNDPILLATIGAVLAGSIFGDHCSPISDTTVLSSMASSCDHLDHVTTQMGYALLVALVSLVVGCLPAGFGIGPLWSLPSACLVLLGVLWLWGRRVDDPSIAVDSVTIEAKKDTQ